MLTELLRVLAPFIAQDGVILAVVVGLVLWAGTSAQSLWLASARVHRAFRSATEQIKQSPDAVSFTSSYESFSTKTAADNYLGDGWRGYSQTLIIPSSAGKPIIATSDARQWFDLPGLFRMAGGDLRYHAALPGLLVGAGLLFTFLGLAAALSAASEVVAEGIEQARRNAALRNLLGAASVKFVTSLAGLFLSIAYALLRKNRLKRVEVAFAAFVTALQERLPFRTPAFLQAEGNAVLEKQYADVQRIGNDFFVNLGSTLEREFGQGLEQHIGPLAAAIEKLSTGLSSQSEDAVQVMLRSFLERLEGAVGESMRATTATLATLGDRLDGLQGGIDAAAQRMGRAAEEMASGMGRGTELALGGITEQMAALVRTMRDAAEEAGRNNRAAGDDLAKQMAATAGALTGAIETFQRRLEDSAADGVGRLTAPIEALLVQLRDLATQQREAGSEATSALAATIARASHALEDTATKVAGVLGSGATDASGRLVAATEAMRDDLRGVLERFGIALNATGAAITKGAVEGGDALRSAAAALGVDLETTVARLRDAGEAAGTALREGGNEARAGMDTAARTLMQGSDSLVRHTADLASAADGLANRAALLNDAARAVAAPLTVGAADLKAAGEAVRDGTRPLQDTVHALRTALDGMASTTEVMRAVQDGTDQLMARLGTAVDRFEGLDVGIAETLRSLNDGLINFQRQVSAFVVNIDDGLARSVNGLTAVAKSLDETIDDLNESRSNGRGGIPA